MKFLSGWAVSVPGGCAVRFGVTCVAGLSGFYLGALRPLRMDSGDARFFSRNMERSSRVVSDCRRNEPENEANLARMKKDKGFGIMFHVKQFLFLPVIHVKRSCFSVR